MKPYLILFFLSILGNTAQGQTDSIREVARLEPLFQKMDSVLQTLEQNGNVIDLVFYSSGLNLQSVVVLWSRENKHYGTSFSYEMNTSLYKRKISQRKIRSILVSRIFNDTCDLCELMNVDKRADLDHDHIMYLKLRKASKCNEIYFTASAYLFYESKNCIYDLRELVATKVNWPGKVTNKR